MRPRAGAAASAKPQVRAVHVIASVDPVYGGPSVSVPALCAAIANAGAEVSLHTVSRRRGVKEGSFRTIEHMQAWPQAPLTQALRWSPELSRALDDAAQTADVVHNHGLWLLPNYYAARSAMGAGTPLVVSPRGMLAPAALRFSPMRKRLFWAAFQRRALADAACLHATSEQELRELRDLGFRNPIAVIPNGVALPPIQDRSPNESFSVLYLGRLHPKKGLDRLFEAWARVEPVRPRWRLLVVGQDEGGHAAELRSLADRLRLQRVSVLPPVYGAERDAIYARSDLFVLPTLNENFGMTVAEALAAGTPVVTTKGAPWSALEANGCGWWIDQGVQPLASSLLHATSLPRAELAQMGQRGKRWVERAFAWDAVASDMLELYRWLAGQSARPSTVDVV